MRGRQDDESNSGFTKTNMPPVCVNLHATWNATEGVRYISHAPDSIARRSDNGLGTKCGLVDEEYDFNKDHD